MLAFHNSICNECLTITFFSLDFFFFRMLWVATYVHINQLKLINKAINLLAFVDRSKKVLVWSMGDWRIPSVKTVLLIADDLIKLISCLQLLINICGFTVFMFVMTLI